MSLLILNYLVSYFFSFLLEYFACQQVKSKSNQSIPALKMSDDDRDIDVESDVRNKFNRIVTNIYYL